MNYRNRFTKFISDCFENAPMLFGFFILLVVLAFSYATGVLGAINYAHFHNDLNWLVPLTATLNFIAIFTAMLMWAFIDDRDYKFVGWFGFSFYVYLFNFVYLLTIFYGHFFDTATVSVWFIAISYCAITMFLKMFNSNWIR